MLNKSKSWNKTLNRSFVRALFALLLGLKLKEVKGEPGRMIQFERVGKMNHRQAVLDEMTFQVEPASISGLCSNQPEAVREMFQLIGGTAKPDAGQVLVDGGEAYSKRKQLESVVGTLSIQNGLTKHGTVKDVLNATLKKAPDNSLTIEQALSIIRQFKVDPAMRSSELTFAQARQVELVSLLMQKLPILLLEHPTEQMDRQQSRAVWQLLADYVDKMQALILFSSPRVAEMQQHAYQIIYLTNGHVTKTRPIETHDSSDSIVTVTGSGLDLDLVTTLGGRFIEETPSEQKFLFAGSIQTLLPLLERSTITDVRIEDATIEDELLIW